MNISNKFMYIFALSMTFFPSLSYADGDTVSGASLEDVHNRVADGYSSFVAILAAFFTIVGFVAFAYSIKRLIKINNNEIQGSPWSALLGMLIASMMSSVGFWMIATSNTIKNLFT